jgi:hypothetical protein
MEQAARPPRAPYRKPWSPANGVAEIRSLRSGQDCAVGPLSSAGQIVTSCVPASCACVRLRTLRSRAVPQPPRNAPILLAKMWMAGSELLSEMVAQSAELLNDGTQEGPPNRLRACSAAGGWNCGPRSHRSPKVERGRSDPKLWQGHSLRLTAKNSDRGAPLSPAGYGDRL